MSSREAFTSILHLFVVFTFFVAGFFFIGLSYFPEIKVQLFEKSTLIGWGLLISALILLLGFYLLDGGRYLVIRMGVAADIHLVRQTLEECFARQFPKQISLAEVGLGRKSRLEIRVSIAPLEEEAREELFIQAEKHLSTLLRERFGYLKPFHLIVKL